MQKSPMTLRKAASYSLPGDNPSFNGSKGNRGSELRADFPFKRLMENRKRAVEMARENESALALSFQHQKSVCL